MSKDNGGPAFPVSDVMALEPRTTAEMVSLAHGMTLRDYFAAQAMTGIIANPENKGSASFFAENAYAIADAMIAERAQ